MTSLEGLLRSRAFRTAQGPAPFEPGAPARGYYNDLRVEVRRFGTTAADVEAALSRIVADRRRANPIDVAQIGLGALQHAASEAAAWLPVAGVAARWLADALDAHGRIAFLFAMPHTFPLEPPWHSAMAQGQAASLLVRAAGALGEPELAAAAVQACGPLLDDGCGLVARTQDGPVLQEYPTDPPAHVLNGWIFALWGLYDAGLPEGGGAADAMAAFEEGARTLERRLPLYELYRGWSRYDLYPHRVVHAASPFYHRLHVAQLAACARLRPDLPGIAGTAARWSAATLDPLALGVAGARKAVHRLATPRRAVR